MKTLFIFDNRNLLYTTHLMVGDDGNGVFICEYSDELKSLSSEDELINRLSVRVRNWQQVEKYFDMYKEAGIKPIPETLQRYAELKSAFRRDRINRLVNQT